MKKAMPSLMMALLVSFLPQMPVHAGGKPAPMASIESIFSTIDFTSPTGNLPSAERTIASIGPAFDTLKKRGPIGVFKTSERGATLVLVESFSDGSEIKRVFRDVDNAEAAILALEPSADSAARNSYSYYATVSGSFWSGGTAYGYAATYGANDGQSWTLINVHYHYDP